MANGNFFTVDRDSWKKTTQLGMNAAAAYLVMASGTGRDNVTTAWSAEAVRRYGGMSWRRAKTAVDLIVKKRLVQKRGTAKKPLYKLPKPKNPIWLPNTIITGADGENPPIMRIRQSQDVAALEAFILLYESQELIEDSGVSRNILYWPYTREHVLDRGQYSVYGFDRSDLRYCCKQGPLKDYADRQQGEVWDHLTVLEDTGVLEWIPHLVEGEGEDAELVHPIGGDEHADKIRDALWDFYERLPGEYGNLGYQLMVPVLRHMKAATMIGVARLRYRPQTSMTAAWYADYTERCEQYVNLYRRIADGDMRLVA